MKKLFAILLAAILLFSMTGCGMENLLSKLGEGSPAGVTNTKNPALIGTWKLVETEDETSATEDSEDGTAVDESVEAVESVESVEAVESSESGTTLSDVDFGMGIEFTEDGKLRYGFDSEALDSVASGANMDDILGGMEMLVTIYYDVKSDTELELTISALMGMQKESQTVTYSLDGDTLVFDGSTYTRVN